MKQILIIEDEAELLEEISDILNYEGYRTVKCKNGEVGIRKAKEILPDLILCDIVMKGTNGFNVLKALKEDCNTCLIPFIYITALDGYNNIRRGMESGADDYLIKPFTREELKKTLDARFFKQGIIENSIKEIRDRVIYSIPHEFSEPLNIIMGFSDIIRKDADNMVAEDISMMGMSIYENSNRLYELIKEYLTYIDTEVNINSKPFCVQQDITHLIEKIVSNVAGLHDRQNDYILEIENCEIEIIEEWFCFAIRELICNAFKFSKTGQPVYIGAKNDGDHYKLIIRDEGRGFPSGSTRKINAFVQFERAIYQQQGIGMGLFIAKRIIELHNGSLLIESEPGKGSAVFVKIPCKHSYSDVN